MLAGHVVLHRRLEVGDDGLEFAHALAALGLVVGSVGEVAGKDHEVGCRGQRVDRGHRLAKRVGRLGIGRAFETPVRVRELDEEEIVLLRDGLAQDVGAGSGQARGENHSAQAEKLHELATSLGFVHVDSLRRHDSTRSPPIPAATDTAGIVMSRDPMVRGSLEPWRCMARRATTRSRSSRHVRSVAVNQPRRRTSSTNFCSSASFRSETAQ